jgi:hypothetical protein
MNLRPNGLVVACLLLVAVVGVAPMSTAAEPTAPVGSDTLVQTDGDDLSQLQETLQEIDEFLETVVDLVRTINQLTGAGEGGD